MLTTAAGLTLSGRIFKRHFVGGMKSCHVIEVLEHLRRYLPAGFILVCDHAPIHTSMETLGYLFAHPEIIVEPLPKYAPELNPEDGFAVPRSRQNAPGQCHTQTTSGNAPSDQSGF